MAQKATQILSWAIQATEMHVQETTSDQNNDVLDTITDQKTVHDGDGVYRFLYRMFALPTEIRELVWHFACDGDYRYTIRLPGLKANGIISAMLALKDPQLRAKGVRGVWKSFPVEWKGRLHSKMAWQRFRKTVIPHIRCLSINFSLSHGAVFNREGEIGDLIAWMERRGKRGNRARYPWNLEQLHLIGLRPMSCVMGGSGWYFWKHYPLPGCKHWSEHWALERLREDGLKVTIETKFDRPFGRTSRWP